MVKMQEAAELLAFCMLMALQVAAVVAVHGQKMETSAHGQSVSEGKPSGNRMGLASV
jgi:hypothetical protein